MANLNDLPIPRLCDVGLQLILDMRERRNYVPDKPTREPKAARQPKQSLPPAVVVANMSEQQIADLYYKLMAKQQKELL